MQNKVEICGVNTAKLKVLKKEETRALLLRAKAGDQQAREELIAGNLRLVLSVLQKFTGRGEQVDDLFQVGCIGLIKAIDNFNTDLDVRFSTYGVPMIVGEIRRYLRDNSAMRVSRSMRDTAYRVLQAKEAYLAKHQKEPTVEELAGMIGVRREEVVFSLDAIADPISLYEPLYSDGADTVCVMDQVRDSRNTDEHWVERIALREAVSHLSPRERKILALRFFQGKTQMEVSTEIGISQAQVSRLVKNALLRIRTELLELGGGRLFAGPAPVFRPQPRATSRIIMMRKPAMTPRVPPWVWWLWRRLASGISSSTTTYSMAPAAKDSSQGRSSSTEPATRTVSTAKTGSTAPLSAPMPNAFPGRIPSCRRGREMAAPSGKFWMPMPSARAVAAVSRLGSPLWAARAKETPTAIPSGMLWKVMARTSRMLRRLAGGRSCRSRSGERWGSRASMLRRKAMPSTEPPAAGSQPGRPMSSARCMAGMSSDHMLAAIITPAAKPSMIWCRAEAACLRKKNTVAEPAAVSRAVKPVPQAAQRSAFVTIKILSFMGLRPLAARQADRDSAHPIPGRDGACRALENKMKKIGQPPLQTGRIILE